MIAVDTTLLLAFEMRELPTHERVRATVAALSRGGQPCFSLAPQVVDEFLHVSTDPRRFKQPLEMDGALGRMRFWWQAREVRHALPSAATVELAMEWMARFSLGRKRILDTSLAAVYHLAGIRRLATGNRADFEVFGVFSFEDWAG